MHRLQHVIIALCLTFAWAATALSLPPQSKSKPTYCDNSGGPAPHNCMCSMATGDDCDAKPQYNMPGCKRDCKPELCKCSPERCS